VEKIENIVNTLISLIPDEIDIPGTDIYLQGGLTQEFHSVKNEYVSLPLDLTLQSERYPLDTPNLANFSDTPTRL